MNNEQFLDVLTDKISEWKDEISAKINEAHTGNGAFDGVRIIVKNIEVCIELPAENWDLLQHPPSGYDVRTDWEWALSNKLNQVLDSSNMKNVPKGI